jgi:hypothetical protein
MVDQATMPRSSPLRVARLRQQPRCPSMATQTELLGSSTRGVIFLTPPAVPLRAPAAAAEWTTSAPNRALRTAAIAAARVCRVSPTNASSTPLTTPLRPRASVPKPVAVGPTARAAAMAIDASSRERATWSAVRAALVARSAGRTSSAGSSHRAVATAKSTTRARQAIAQAVVRATFARRATRTSRAVTAAPRASPVSTEGRARQTRAFSPVNRIRGDRRSRPVSRPACGSARPYRRTTARSGRSRCHTGTVCDKTADQEISRRPSGMRCSTLLWVGHAEARDCAPERCLTRCVRNERRASILGSGQHIGRRQRDGAKEENR